MRAVRWGRAAAHRGACGELLQRAVDDDAGDKLPLVNVAGEGEGDDVRIDWMWLGGGEGEGRGGKPTRELFDSRIFPRSAE